MARRRLSGRQLERIRAIQERRRRRLEERLAVGAEHDDEPQDAAEPQAGRVIVRHGAGVAVEDEAGALHQCRIRRHTGHPVCGDRVVWQPTGQGTGLVTALLERETVLSRPDYSGRDKPLAANISLMAVVIAVRPAPSGYLLDQYLVAAALIGVDAVIVLNKSDLLSAAEAADFQAVYRPYAAIGHPLLPVSVKGPPGLDALTPQLRGRTTILLGQSGVGKSSLIQALLPDQEVQTGRLSEATGLGRHTTSAATCYHLPGGGHLIDSPGVRSFRLGPMDRSRLERGFREFAPYLGRCRFADCRHQQEPDCAIRAAAAAGAIDPRRLASFHQLAQGLA